MLKRPDCESFEEKEFEHQTGDCQTDGHFMCKYCKHIAEKEDLEESDNVKRYYPEK